MATFTDKQAELVVDMFKTFLNANHKWCLYFAISNENLDTVLNFSKSLVTNIDPHKFNNSKYYLLDFFEKHKFSFFEDIYKFDWCKTVDNYEDMNKIYLKTIDLVNSNYYDFSDNIKIRMLKGVFTLIIRSAAELDMFIEKNFHNSKVEFVNSLFKSISMMNNTSTGGYLPLEKTEISKFQYHPYYTYYNNHFVVGICAEDNLINLCFYRMMTHFIMDKTSDEDMNKKYALLDFSFRSYQLNMWYNLFQMFVKDVIDFDVLYKLMTKIFADSNAEFEMLYKNLNTIVYGNGIFFDKINEIANNYAKAIGNTKKTALRSLGDKDYVVMFHYSTEYSGSFEIHYPSYNELINNEITDMNKERCLCGYYNITMFFQNPITSQVKATVREKSLEFFNKFGIKPLHITFNDREKITKKATMVSFNIRNFNYDTLGCDSIMEDLGFLKKIMSA